jgi:regulatory protein NPR1
MLNFSPQKIALAIVSRPPSPRSRAAGHQRGPRPPKMCPAPPPPKSLVLAATETLRRRTWKAVIPVNSVSYEVFLLLLQFLYSGQVSLVPQKGEPRPGCSERGCWHTHCTAVVGLALDTLATARSSASRSSPSHPGNNCLLCFLISLVSVRRCSWN